MKYVVKPAPPIVPKRQTFSLAVGIEGSNAPPPYRVKGKVEHATAVERLAARLAAWMNWAPDDLDRSPAAAARMAQCPEYVVPASNDLSAQIVLTDTGRRHGWKRP